MKKIILGIIGITIIIGGYAFYQYKPDRITTTKAYYQELTQECNTKENKKCCLDSIKEMEKIDAFAIDSDTGVCDYGYEREMLNCADSFAWCKPLTINETSKEDFYQDLKDNCEKTRTDKNQLSCCLDSVKTMEVVGSTKLFPGGKYEKSGEYDCGEGLTRMTLRCPGSYAWCQTSNNPEGEDFVPVPQNATTIKPLNEPDFIPTEFNQIKLPDNVITEKDCAAAGGEVWNTLGETSYDGELIGKIEGLKCPCACLVRNEGADKIWVNVNGNMEEFKGNLDDIQTFDDCKKAGFQIKDEEPEICIVGEPHMTNGKYKTFYNNPMEAGKTCEDYHYSTCPGSCVAKCVSSSCGEPDENGAVACTSDCDGVGSCVSK